jgi:hypothetical protein
VPLTHFEIVGGVAVGGEERTYAADPVIRREQAEGGRLPCPDGQGSLLAFTGVHPPTRRPTSRARPGCLPRCIGTMTPEPKER